MKEILEEIGDEAAKLMGSVSGPRAYQTVEAALDSIAGQAHDAAAKRQALVSIAAHTAMAIAEIDAEAERGKYLEQARALLVAAHGAGIDRLYWYGGQMTTLSPNGYVYGHEFKTSSTDEAVIEALARVLQERKAAL